MITKCEYCGKEIKQGLLTRIKHLETCKNQELGKFHNQLDMEKVKEVFRGLFDHENKKCT